MSTDSENDELVIEINERSVHIKELDLNKLYPLHPGDVKNGSKYVFIGKPGSGKSTLIESLLYAKKHICAAGFFWSGTEDSNGFFQKFAPPSFIRSGDIDIKNLTAFENIKKRQKIARRFLEPRGDNPWIADVLDDCTSDAKFLKKPIFQDIYKNGRHQARMHILSLQFCLDIPSALRSCIDGTFICRDPNPKSRIKLYENFGSCVDNISDWNDLMDGLTNDYCCMFINNKVQTSNIEDTIFYYKATPDRIPVGWKFGCRDYWDFHSDRYDPNHADINI